MKKEEEEVEGWEGGQTRAAEEDKLEVGCQLRAGDGMLRHVRLIHPCVTQLKDRGPVTRSKKREKRILMRVRHQAIGSRS